MRAIRPSPARATPAIGAKLRESRRAQALTIAHVAEATGLDKGFISKVERDETSPSVATLLAICDVLSVEVGSLFADPAVEVITLADAPLINMGGTAVIERLITPRAEGRVQVLRSTLEPDATGGTDLYTINCDVEVVHVVSGQVTIRLTTGAYELEAGDSFTLPGREPHTWDNRSAGPSEVIWVIVPAAWSGSSPR